eukprot:6807650-Pyramimonas_sp.AAC.1
MGSRNCKTGQLLGCASCERLSRDQIGTQSSNKRSRAAWPASGKPPSSSGARTGSGTGRGPLLNLCAARPPFRTELWAKSCHDLRNWRASAASLQETSLDRSAKS